LLGLYHAWTAGKEEQGSWAIRSNCCEIVSSIKDLNWVRFWQLSVRTCGQNQSGPCWAIDGNTLGRRWGVGLAEPQHL